MCPSKVPEGGPEKFIGLDFKCDCGKRHRIDVRHVEVGRDVLRNIPLALRDLGLTGRFALVYDKHVRPIAESVLFHVLDHPGVDYDVVCFERPEELKGTIETSDELRAMLPKTPTFLMVIGSGTMNDLTKWAATVLNIPYVVVATAPSMNGYTSSISALSSGGFKTTQDIRPATAVFADVDVMKDAPIEMIRAGLGDLLSKNVCNADWRLSRRIRNTYFCEIPSQMTRKQERYYLEHARELGERDPEAVRMLTEALMISGFSMAVVGESSPSSGSEHLISHYWEMQKEMSGQPIQLHGAQVGVGTLIAADIYERMRRKSPGDIDLTRARSLHKSSDELRAIVGKYYGAVAESTFRETIKKVVSWSQKEKELVAVRDNWDDLWRDVSRFLRGRAELEKALSEAGCPCRARDLDISRRQVYDAIRFSRLLRNRYTILDLAEELGWLEPWAEELADEFGS